MRVFLCVLILAGVFGSSIANAQEADPPRNQPLPWWKLSDSPSAVAQKADPPKSQPSPWWMWPDSPAATNTPQATKEQPRARDHVPRSSETDAAGKAQPRAEARSLERQPAPASDPMATPPASHAAPTQPRERLIYRLANTPAADIAKTVNELLRSEQPRATPGDNLVVLAEPLTNSLVLSGTADQIHQAARFIEQLDTRPPMVCLQVVIALAESPEGLSILAPGPDGPKFCCSPAEANQMIDRLGKSGALKVLARPQLVTLDNQPAFLQIGQRVPRITSARDGQTVATELDNVGLIVGATPRISPDLTVTVEIDVEKSEISSDQQGIPLGVDAKGNVVRSPKVDTTTVQTTIAIPPGQAMVVGGLALQDGDKRGELVVVVVPHIIQAEK
ncbi:MAG: type II secretion system protein GspD [Thermoguttaceae bacterium]